MLYVLYSSTHFLELIKSNSVFGKLKEINVSVSIPRGLYYDISDEATGVIIEFPTTFNTLMLKLFLVLLMQGVPTYLVIVDKRKLPFRFRFLNFFRYVLVCKSRGCDLSQLVYKPRLEGESLYRDRGYRRDYVSVDRPFPLEIEYVFKKVSSKLPYLVFYHGVGARPQMYLNFLDHFASRFNIVAFSLPYHGRSGEPLLLMSYDEYALYLSEALREVIIRFNLPLNRSIVMGHSLGGGIAWSVVSRFPFKKLILLNPAGLFINKRYVTLGVLALLDALNSLIDLSYLPRETRKKVVFETFITLFMGDLLGRTTKTSYLFKQFMKILKSGFVCPPQIHERTNSVLVTSTKEVYFTRTYYDLCTQHLGSVRHVKVKGNHVWPILRPWNAKQILRVLE